MPANDRYGLPLSTSSGAAEHYRSGVDLLLSLWPGADASLERAIALDPDFALAWAARARLHLIDNEVSAARSAVERAQRLIVQRGTERERSHVQVLQRLVAGESAQALQGALDHAERWPRDILILGLPLGAFGLLAFSGRADHDQARVDLCERHARHFAADDWWFQTYHGWALGENGDVLRGRTLTEKALELRRQNVNAAHALTHVLHESGASEEAARLIADWLPEYPRHGTLHGHIAWHGALVALERGDDQGALAFYETYVAPAHSTAGPLNRVSDNASFLWRLALQGREVPAALWQATATSASGLFPQPGLPFADVHMAMLAAATGDRSAVDARLSGLAARLEAGTLPAGPVVALLCRALLAFAEEDYRGCIQLLEPVRADIARIGGSGAQREVFEDTLLVALMRSGESEQALALLDERLHRRPSRRDGRWLTALAAEGKFQ
ncbi:tetratricopeptide repeat protein [Pseudomonas oryzihabitans]|uniref:tetratricopeptide repeat protein n=1 Tax=Pseudomonas oryzihabitans TaxID=47885 RepID=UPI0028948B83|nr:tetratricopeptide repeat protein [Pseudomonas oryzihabitans]MDT3722273.1 tetratricopeptide repeat protein [Pseudomonas oryzihabitans]